jgi:hypothetical protein
MMRLFAVSPRKKRVNEEAAAGLDAKAHVYVSAAGGGSDTRDDR